MATEYVASFGIVQIALKIGDKGLQLAEDALDMAGVGKSKLMEPVKRGIHKIRRDARVIRRAGAKLTHPKPAPNHRGSFFARSYGRVVLCKFLSV